MGELIVQPNEQELLQVLNSVGEHDILPMPFERDIFLFGTEIAGTNYAENIHALYESLNEGDIVALIREPDNPYDEYAIRIETVDSELIGYIPSEKLALETGFKLGYVPRLNNKIIARLMDAGKLIYGRIRHKEMIGDYHKIVVKIYLKD